MSETNTKSTSNESQSSQTPPAQTDTKSQQKEQLKAGSGDPVSTSKQSKQQSTCADSASSTKQQQQKQQTAGTNTKSELRPIAPKASISGTKHNESSSILPCCRAALSTGRPASLLSASSAAGDQKIAKIQAERAKHQRQSSADEAEKTLALVSCSGPEALSCRSAPAGIGRLAPKGRRRLLRARKELHEAAENKSAATPVQQNVIPQSLMLTSSQPGQFMIVQHGGQCYMVPTAPYIGTNHQLATVRFVNDLGYEDKQQQQLAGAGQSLMSPELSKMSEKDKQLEVEGQQGAAASSSQAWQRAQQQQSQQQVAHQNALGANTTLGHLARSIMPKTPSTSGSISNATQVLSTMNVTNPTTTGAVQSLTPGTAFSVPHGQHAMFQPGILRAAPQGTSGFVFQMPSGAYTYVQQVLPPNQRQILPQQSQQQLTSQTSLSSSTKPGANANNESPKSLSAQSQSENCEGNNAATTQAGATRHDNAKGAIGSAKNLIKTVQASSTGTKTQTSSSNIARPVAMQQQLAPTNLVPIGAPMQMMLMPTSLSSFQTSPLVSASGQLVHQPLIPGQPISGTQMIPVFQQQQNMPRFQTPYIHAAHDMSFINPSDVDERPPRLTADDGGVENEPPPLLMQGESKDARDVHDMFTKEAEFYRERIGRRSKVVHLVNGFEIEESHEPFISDCPLNLLDLLAKEFDCKICTDEKQNEEIERKYSLFLSDGSFDGSNEKTECINEKEDNVTSTKIAKEEKKQAKKKTRRRKTNELDRLLQMDFGPAQGRLRDILGSPLTKISKTTMNKSTEELAKKTQIIVETEEAAEKDKNEQKEEEKLEKTPAEEKLFDAKESSKQESAANEEIVEAEGETTKAVDESNTTARSSLNLTETNNSINSSKTSAESPATVGGGVQTVSFSDEELDTERCNYCNGLLRLKRLENHPQYCSKKCRKLWRKNPAVSEETVSQSMNTSPGARPAVPAQPIKDLTPTAQSTPVVSDQSLSSPVPVCEAQRSPPVLTLKKVSPQQAEIVKPQKGTTNEPIKIGQVIVSRITSNESLDFLTRNAQTWNCDEVARWIAAVTGNPECAKVFLNQDIDGQSLLLLAENNAHHNLSTLLGLKLGPVVKILNALRELTAKQT